MKTKFGWMCWCLVALAGLLHSGCSETITVEGAGGGVGGQGASGGGGSGGSAGGATTSSQVDVLLVVDNSRGVQFAQQTLADSVPKMIADLTALGVSDMHIAVVSSSLGGLGADVCSIGAEENDRARLLTRGPSGPVATHEDRGFLFWDPNQTAGGETDEAALISGAQDLVSGSGAEGCGYESTLEAFYRFLIEPEPYETITVESGTAVPSGTDTDLLQQRADFLRPDSLLLVVIASDENDCSTRAEGQFYFSRQVRQPGSVNPFNLPVPRAACAEDPASACCRSCGQEAGPGCDTSLDQCQANGPALSAIEDAINLRCFDQKRRFGIDFLYPIDRYITGLSAAQVPDRLGNVVNNPLFAEGRGTELVLVASLVGIAPSLANRGGSASNGAQVASEITDWAALIGDPATYSSPTNPYMVESIAPRAGIAGPGSTYDADAIVGHDFPVPNRDNLQNACLWELPQPVDCSFGDCFCMAGVEDSKCQDPTDNSYSDMQHRAGATPGTRFLELMRGLDSRGVVGSICPEQLSDNSQGSFGHHPALSTLVELAETRLE